MSHLSLRSSLFCCEILQSTKCAKHILGATHCTGVLVTRDRVTDLCCRRGRSCGGLGGTDGSQGPWNPCLSAISAQSTRALFLTWCPLNICSVGAGPNGSSPPSSVCLLTIYTHTKRAAHRPPQGLSCTLSIPVQVGPLWSWGLLGTPTPSVSQLEPRTSSPSHHEVRKPSRFWALFLGIQ